MTCVVSVCLLARPSVAQTAFSGSTIHITKATGHITIDGDLSDEAWQHATRIDKWYETQPGDNVEPKVKNVGYLTFDDRFFYAAFEFEDPDPAQMRAPFADRDNIGDGFDDYGGISSTRGVDRGVLRCDASQRQPTRYRRPLRRFVAGFLLGLGGRSTRTADLGSAFRFRRSLSQRRSQTWRILLYRNYPRDRHYQFFSARIARQQLLVCRSNVLTGLERSLRRPGSRRASGDTLACRDVGAPLGKNADGHAGDVILPNADNASI